MTVALLGPLEIQQQTTKSE